MQRTGKRLLSLLLCVLLLWTAVGAAQAADDAVTPVIVVSGMGSFPLYSGETGEQVWGPQTKDILKVVGDALLPTAKAIVKRDLNILADESFDDVYRTLFEVVSCDETGEPLHPVDAVLFPQSVDHYPEQILNAEETEDELAILKTLAAEVGPQHVYFFNYDWRLSPLAHADTLHDFIETVKQEQHADKVTLVPCSMGGTVVNSYLARYGSADLEKIVYCLVASKGIDLVGELFGQNINIDVSVLLERLFNFENGNLATQTLLGALKAGFELNPLLTKALNKLLQTVLDKTSERAYRDILLRSFASMPGMWAFVPEDYYETDKARMFPDGANPAFLEKIDGYHDVQVQAEELMQQAIDGGTAIYITAAYGYVGFPVTDKAYAQGDCLIETHNEAFGATTAPYGQTLPADYAPENPVCSDPAHDHISNDLIVDASTCAFPEQTWIIKHMKHVGFPVGSDAAKLLTWLVTSEDALTVESDARFPQFTDLDPLTGRLTSLTGGEKKAQLFDRESNLWIRFCKFFVDLWHKLQTLFQK